jgi:hypothetical protein
VPMEQGVTYKSRAPVVRRDSRERVPYRNGGSGFSTGIYELSSPAHHRSLAAPEARREAPATMSSTLYLHVGQAGNEIGSAFWRLAAAEKPPKRWLFDERGRARLVLVDTEPKVVRGVVRSLGDERVHPRCALVEQSGRGNNWAMGFHGTGTAAPGAPSIADAALEALRWQWERCDSCNGLVMCHSLGGGTGSGLGSLLLQKLRDAHPRHYLTSLAVGPFAGGELPLSAYNSALSLSFVQEHCDAVLLFDNSQLLRQLQSAAATASHAAAAKLPPRLCMAQLDAYVADTLAGVTFPTDGVRGRRPFDAGELVGSVCPMGAMKMLQLSTAPSAPRVAPPLGGVGGGSGVGGGGGGGSGGSSSSTGGGVGCRPPPTKPPPAWASVVAEAVERVPRYDLHQRPVVTLCTQACRAYTVHAVCTHHARTMHAHGAHTSMHSPHGARAGDRARRGRRATRCAQPGAAAAGAGPVAVHAAAT